MTVYFVDEDYPKFKAWLLELEYRNMTVRPITDADRAYQVLLEANDVEWVVIDVMLAASEKESTRFDAGRTDGSLETGLVLLRDLCDARPDVFPRRAQLLTNTTNQTTYRAAQQCAAEFSIDLIDKTSVDGARDFGDKIVAAMAAARARGGSDGRAGGYI